MAIYLIFDEIAFPKKNFVAEMPRSPGPILETPPSLRQQADQIQNCCLSCTSPLDPFA